MIANEADNSNGRMTMNDYDMAKCAAQAQDAMGGGGIMAGSSLQNAVLSKQQPMRDRVQVCHKRASGVVAMLANLTSAVLPPTPMAATGPMSGEQLKDSTLSGDIDDLARTISQIETQVMKLSVAITGAA